MPLAVTHILVPLILLALFKDRYDKNHKNKFSLHYVLIAGLAGILPDLDVVAFWILSSFGFTFEQVHKTFLHSLFIPTIFLILFVAFKRIKIKELGRHKLRINLIFLMISIGSFIHLILDALFGEPFSMLYPINNFVFGVNLIGYLPQALRSLAMPSLDAALLIIWLIYLELKHKISDFI